MQTYKIAVIPGDGIGKEVVPAAIEVLDTIAKLDGSFQFEWTYFPLSSFWDENIYLESLVKDL